MFKTKAFVNFYFKVGFAGLRRAATMAIQKLSNTAKLPNYKNPSNESGSRTFERILEWRKYLSLRLDKTPDSIIHSSRLQALTTSIEKNGSLDLVFLTSLLKDFRVNDNHEKSARLLATLLSEDNKGRDKMSKITCFTCFQSGHHVRPY